MLYAAVGFGGGSSYQAVLALLGCDHNVLRFLALSCNLVVVSSGSFLFFKKGCLDVKNTFVLSFASIPAAYLGGTLLLREEHYFILLAFLLIAASFLLFFHPETKAASHSRLYSFFTAADLGRGRAALLCSLLLGGSLGFLAGLVGIGGGIFLAPILHFIRWNRAKAIAASSSFFILVNSAAGLAGQYMQQEVSTYYHDMFLYCVLSVFLGGQIGSRISITYFYAVLIKKITALFMLLAAIHLLIKYT